MTALTLLHLSRPPLTLSRPPLTLSRPPVTLLHPPLTLLHPLLTLLHPPAISNSYIHGNDEHFLTAIRI